MKTKPSLKHFKRLETELLDSGWAQPKLRLLRLSILCLASGQVVTMSGCKVNSLEFGTHSTIATKPRLMEASYSNSPLYLFHHISAPTHTHKQTPTCKWTLIPQVACLRLPAFELQSPQLSSHPPEPCRSVDLALIGVESVAILANSQPRNEQDFKSLNPIGVFHISSIVQLKRCEKFPVIFYSTNNQRSFV